MLASKIIKIAAHLALNLCATFFFAQACPNYNYFPPPYENGNAGTKDHDNGEHEGAVTLTPSCTYTSIGEQNCATYCTADSYVGTDDYGELAGVLLDVHEITQSMSGGGATSNGGAASCASSGAWTATSCTGSCSIQIGINATASGIGTTFSFPATNLGFNTQYSYTQNCVAKADPQHTAATPTFSPAPGIYVGSQTVTLSDSTSGATVHCTTNGSTATSSSPVCTQVTLTAGQGYTLNAVATASGYSSSAEASGVYTLDPDGGGVGGSGGPGCGTCSCGGVVSGGQVVSNCPNGCCPSPIIVDTTGHGFHLTAATTGVRFDIRGDGHPIQVAWTDATSGNAFLALDRNADGKIDNGKELFGNFTEQSPAPAYQRNGYRALAEFDQPENGGNGDGIIDSRDAVYSKLVLWIDANHDGISQPNELQSLSEMGVFSIGLRYRNEPLTDQFGNGFRYRGVLNPNPVDGESKDGRFTYDVFFRVVPSKDANASSCRPAQTAKAESEPVPVEEF